jgi:hypothetical protein
MEDSTKDEILEQLGEGEETLLVVMGALPQWVSDEYDPSGDEVAELIRHSEKAV